MDRLAQLFDRFSVAYQHSLYAINQEEERINKKRSDSRVTIKKQYERERSKSATACSNNLMATLHKLKDTCSQMSQDESTIIRTADYLLYGKSSVDNLKMIIHSDVLFPCIIPFIGQGNVMLESEGDECHAVGLQFALQALLQTAPGQLSITVINPELRPEFSTFTRLIDFQMLAKSNEIQDFLASITEELVEIDSLLQGRYSSLVELRRVAQQPVGRLRLIVIQDLPKSLGDDSTNQLIRVVKGAPRAGIAVLCLHSKGMSFESETMKALRGISNLSFFKCSGNQWYSQSACGDKLTNVFPLKDSDTVLKEVNELIKAAKDSSAITIPFRQIECSIPMWSEDSTESITFNLGKNGLDTVSVCIGDEVMQHHNILISGAVGKGKSNLLEVMIHSLCWRYSPKDLELYLLDFKDGLTFKPYADREDKSWLPHARMLGLESDRDVGLAVLKDLEKERLHRSELFKNASNGGAKGYEVYRKKHPQNIVPRILLVIDEYQKLFETNDDISEEAAALLENLVRQGRACAIHVVLASQSINGTAGLLGKDERIYAQFPVRIALQNTVSESYALFGIGNDAAAQLRVRGEAVINENYGSLDSNQRFTVAYAEQQDIKQIRQAFCRECDKRYPVVFTRQDSMDFSKVIHEVKKWRDISSASGVIHIPIGVRLSVDRDIISLPFMNDVGKNIAILGAAENLQKEGVVPGKYNMAVGMVQSICVALALQHPDGNARFVLIDGLGQEVFKNSNTDRWSQLMERLGFPIELIASYEAVDWLTEFKHGINGVIAEEDTYILCMGMDSISDFSEISLFGESGADIFQQLLKYGNKGVHFICWWSNVNTYKTHIGFGNESYFETKVLLRMDRDTSRDVLGPFISWSVRENRAYVHDNSELPSDEMVIPLMPMNNRICGIVESERW